jgi:hypothetical protein
MWTSNFYGGWDYWSLYHKVTFDGPNLLIRVNYGETDINVDIDLYSDWKEWLRVRDNMKYVPAFSTIGGEPIGGSQFIGATYFLENGWRIKPWEGDHNLAIGGNIFTREEGDTIYAPTVDRWQINASNKVSALVFKVETTSGTSGSVSVDASAIAQAVWDYSVTSSLADNTFGDQVYRKILTLAQYMATK